MHTRHPCNALQLSKAHVYSLYVPILHTSIAHCDLPLARLGGSVRQSHSSQPLPIPSHPNPSDNPIFTLEDPQPHETNPNPPFSSSTAAFTLPDLEDDRSTLWRGVYALGRNMDGFVQRQNEEAEANRAALNAIVERLGSTLLSSTCGSGMPKFREPRVFNGHADQVDGFL